MSAPLVCSRCGRHPRVPRQRWCGPCRAEYKRTARSLLRGTGGNGLPEANRMLAGDSGPGKAEGVLGARQSASQKGRPALAPPAPYVPFADAAAPQEPWCAVFLSDLAINGGMSLAAAAAGVHRNRVYRRIGADPAFAAEVEAAQGYYRDLLEWESVDLARRKDNPLPYFARLKAELPSRYIDRQAVFLATDATLDPVAGQALLATMLGHLPQPATTPALEPPEAGILPGRPTDSPE